MSLWTSAPLTRRRDRVKPSQDFTFGTLSPPRGARELTYGCLGGDGLTLVPFSPSPFWGEGGAKVKNRCRQSVVGHCAKPQPLVQGGLFFVLCCWRRVIDCSCRATQLAFTCGNHLHVSLLRPIDGSQFTEFGLDSASKALRRDLMRRKQIKSRVDPTDQACRFHDLAVSCRAQGKLEQAESYALRSLKIFEKACGPQHPDIANVANNLAGVYEDKGEYDRAEKLYLRSVRIMKNLRDGADLERLRVQSLTGLAGVYRAQGRYNKAEPVYREALTIAEKVFGHKDLEVSAVLNNLAVLYKYTGQFKEAGQLYRRALAITEKLLGSDHPEVATIYHNLGGLEHSRGRFARGEPFARRSVEIRQKALGSNHPAVAADMAALAGSLGGPGK